MDNPALSMLCEAIKPELLRLKPGETQVVALPDVSLVKPGQTQVVAVPFASLVGDIEQEFVA